MADLDPSIALSVRAPQVENPQDIYARTMSLADMMQRRQLQQQQMQENELKMTQQRNAMADDQLMGQTIAKNTQIGPDGQPVTNHSAIIQTLAAAGKGHLANTYTQSMIAQQRADIEAHGKQIDLWKKKVDLGSNVLGAVANYDLPNGTPSGLEATFQNARRTLLSAGLGDPAMPTTVLKADNTVNPDALQWVNQATNQAMQYKDQLDEQQKKVSSADAHRSAQLAALTGEAKLPDEQLKSTAAIMKDVNDQPSLDAARAMLLAPGTDGKPKIDPAIVNRFGTTFGPTFQDSWNSAGMTAAQQGEQRIQQQKADREKQSEQEWIAKRNDPNSPPEVRAQMQANLDELARQKKAGAINNNTFTVDERRQATQDVAHGLATGDLVSLRNLAGMRQGDRMMVYALAKRENPSFNPSTVDRQLVMLNNLDNGVDGRNIQSFDQFLQHAGMASQVFDDLKQTDATILNHSINWLRANSTSPQYRRVLAAIEPVKKEYETFLLNNRALYESDRKSSDAIMSEDVPLKDFQAAAQQMGETAIARVGAYNQRFKRVMGKDLPPELFSQEAIDASKKIGVDMSKFSGVEKPGTATPAAAPPPAKQPSAAPPGKIAVISPEGVPGFIPAEKWEAAQKRGFKKQ